MVGAYEADPQMPIGFERLRWKITTTLRARTVRRIAVLALHHTNLDLALQMHTRWQRYELMPQLRLDVGSRDRWACVDDGELQLLLRLAGGVLHRGW